MEQEAEYKDFVSADAIDLMKKMIEKNVKLRLTANEVLAHPWLEDIDTQINIFDEQYQRRYPAKKLVYQVSCTCTLQHPGSLRPG